MVADIAVTCDKCSSNRIDFPAHDDDVVTCGDCGHALATLGVLKAQVERGMAERR